MAMPHSQAEIEMATFMMLDHRTKGEIKRELRSRFGGSTYRPDSIIQKAAFQLYADATKSMMDWILIASDSKETPMRRRYARQQVQRMGQSQKSQA